MKKNTDGSILLWSIFFILFLSFSFLMISESIEQELTSQKPKEVEKSLLSESKTATKKGLTTELSDSIKTNPYFVKSFTTTMTKGEVLTLSGSKNQKNMSITVLSGGPLKILSYSGGILTNEKAVPTTTTSTLSGSVFELSNLGGLCQFQITPSPMDPMLYPYNYIVVQKYIGNIPVLYSSEKIQ